MQTEYVTCILYISLSFIWLDWGMFQTNSGTVSMLNWMLRLPSVMRPEFLKVKGTVVGFISARSRPDQACECHGGGEVLRSCSIF
jgi:hypothetical protein